MSTRPSQMSEEDTEKSGFTAVVESMQYFVLRHAGDVADYGESFSYKESSC